ncbi:hypothetical protein JYT99_00605 [bacterium AH-315-E09]|nr:hypothetical protein [Alkaliphilus sp. AH-315-G20]MBN4074410.1 hypothetical protein [bacterium AH-315-E09]
MAVNFVLTWTTWLLLLIPAGAIVMIAYFSLMKMVSTDEQTILMFSKKTNSVLKGLVISVTLVGLIAVIRAFY